MGLGKKLVAKVLEVVGNKTGLQYTPDPAANDQTIVQKLRNPNHRFVQPATWTHLKEGTKTAAGGTVSVASQATLGGALGGSVGGPVGAAIGTGVGFLTGLYTANKLRGNRAITMAIPQLFFSGAATAAAQGTSVPGDNWGTNVLKTLAEKSPVGIAKWLQNQGHLGWAGLDAPGAKTVFVPTDKDVSVSDAALEHIHNSNSPDSADIAKADRAFFRVNGEDGNLTLTLIDRDAVGAESVMGVYHYDSTKKFDVLRDLMGAEGKDKLYVQLPANGHLSGQNSLVAASVKVDGRVKDVKIFSPKGATPDQMAGVVTYVTENGQVLTKRLSGNEVVTLEDHLDNGVVDGSAPASLVTSVGSMDDILNSILTPGDHLLANALAGATGADATKYLGMSHSDLASEIATVIGSSNVFSDAVVGNYVNLAANIAAMNGSSHDAALAELQAGVKQIGHNGTAVGDYLAGKITGYLTGLKTKWTGDEDKAQLDTYVANFRKTFAKDFPEVAKVSPGNLEQLAENWSMYAAKRDIKELRKTAVDVLGIDPALVANLNQSQLLKLGQEDGLKDYFTTVATAAGNQSATKGIETWNYTATVQKLNAYFADRVADAKHQAAQEFWTGAYFTSDAITSRPIAQAGTELTDLLQSTGAPGSTGQFVQWSYVFDATNKTPYTNALNNKTYNLTWLADYAVDVNFNYNDLVIIKTGDNDAQSAGLIAAVDGRAYKDGKWDLKNAVRMDTLTAKQMKDFEAYTSGGK